jgi:fatty-acyl-CoA synthase
MSAAQNQYSIGLEKTPANFVALTPLSFLAGLDWHVSICS